MDHDVMAKLDAQLVLQNVVYVKLDNARDVYIEQEDIDISVPSVTDYKFFYLFSKQKNKNIDTYTTYTLILYNEY